MELDSSRWHESWVRYAEYDGIAVIAHPSLWRDEWSEEERQAAKEGKRYFNPVYLSQPVGFNICIVPSGALPTFAHNESYRLRCVADVPYDILEAVFSSLEARLLQREFHALLRQRGPQ